MSGHSFADYHKRIMSYNSKHIMLCQYKQIVRYRYKLIMLTLYFQMDIRQNKARADACSVLGSSIVVKSSPVGRLTLLNPNIVVSQYVIT